MCGDDGVLVKAGDGEAVFKSAWLRCGRLLVVRSQVGVALLFGVAVILFPLVDFRTRNDGVPLGELSLQIDFLTFCGVTGALGSGVALDSAFAAFVAARVFLVFM